ncbi:hypothetical protein A9X06_26450 [Mycobacterium sp. 852002-51759_SCH5129042]|nr:hypothetical protein A9X06_26450 [Mycobacterium sp. 852002-51759_SCH5129042]
MSGECRTQAPVPSPVNSQKGRGDVLSVPGPTYAFVGRDGEVVQIRGLLQRQTVRLLTLVGTGGIGKTRLAAEAVRRFTADNAQARVYWVRLARLPASAGLAQLERETASAVIQADFSDKPTRSALVDALNQDDHTQTNRRTLLVLDNCEHLSGRIGEMVTYLLDHVPALTIIATSREAIGCVDEYIIGVSSLSKDHAVALFGQLAESIGRPLLDDEQVQIAGAICRHVHNNPLFIQLTASRLMRQPLQGILDDLSGRADDRRFDWGTDARAGAEERHRAVTDVIAWSRDLCTDKERLLFDRLAVFAPGHDNSQTDLAAEVGADLDAIVFVCSDAPSDREESALFLAAEEIEGLLNRLCDQSLVSRHFTTSVVRYSLLESLRLYAWKCLQERSVEEAERVTLRHLLYYRDKVSEARQHWFSASEQDVLLWSKAAWDNIITAIETAIATPSHAAAGVEICLGLIELRVPFVKSSMRDIRRWTQQCLDASDSDSNSSLAIAAQAAMAWLAVRQGQSVETDRLLLKCVEASIAEPDRQGWRESDDDPGFPALVDLAWGTALFMADRDRRAVAVLLRASDKFEQAGNGGSQMMAEMFAGMAAATLGSPADALTIAARCLHHAQASGARWAVSWAELSWAVALTKNGDPAEAAEVLRRALACQCEVGDQWGAAWSVELLTWALAAAINGRNPSDYALATDVAHLAGGVEKVRARLGIDIEAMGTFADESRKAEEVAKRVLGKKFQDARSLGEELRPETFDVHRVAMGTLVMPGTPGTVVGEPFFTLTEVEREVAIYAAAGWNNARIAGMRRKSVRTIDSQIISILKKLNVDGRDGIIDHIPTRLLDAVERAKTTASEGAVVAREYR